MKKYINRIKLLILCIMDDTNQQNQIWNIYVLKLENNKWFIHLVKDNSESNHDDIIILECKVLYNFVKKNHPINVINIITTYDFLEIDLYVKQYMYQYGIDNVRGGLYTDEILSPTVITILNQLLFTKNKHIIENQNIMETIYQNYNSDIISLHATTEYINCEKQRLNDKLTKYKNIENQIYTLKYLPNNVIIDRKMLSDLEWIRTQILCSRYSKNNLQKTVEIIKNDQNIMEEDEENDITIINNDLSWVTKWIQQNVSEYVEPDENLSKNEIDNKYRVIISKMKEVYACYNKIFYEKPIEYSPQLYLNRPDIVFDTFIYHLNSIQNIDNAIREAIHLLAKFEYMTYNLINRIDEAEHMLSIYPEYYERLIECSCKFLDNIHM